MNVFSYWRKQGMRKHEASTLQTHATKTCWLKSKPLDTSGCHLRSLGVLYLQASWTTWQPNKIRGPHCGEYEDRVFHSLRIVGTHLPDYTAPHLRRRFSPLPEILKLYIRLVECVINMPRTEGTNVLCRYSTNPLKPVCYFPPSPPLISNQST